MGSGLIYAAIAIMWAAVLIPMWLRNHDTATENRSAERFGQAMRVLSRKEGGSVPDEESSDLGEPADPPSYEERAEPSHRPPSQARGEARAPRPARVAAQRVARAAAATKDRRQRRASRAPLTLIQRRARTLGVLTGLTFVTLLLAAVTPLPVWVAVPFLLLTVAFVVHLRVQARQKLQRHQRVARPIAAPSVETKSDRAVGEGTRQADSSDQSGVVQGPSRAVVVERKGDAAPAASADLTGAAADTVADADDDAWRPNPLPLPTYVTAPKAVRPIKVIDLTTPGAWSSGRLFDDELAEEDLLAAQVAEDELDALLDQEIARPAGDGEDGSQRAVGD